METGVRFIDDIMVISFYGELHSVQTDAITFKVNELVKQTDKIILNCSDLEYIDSKGLGCLIRINNHLKDLNKKMIICCVSGKVKKVFDLTRFNDYIEIFENINDALDFFRE